MSDLFWSLLAVVIITFIAAYALAGIMPGELIAIVASLI